MNLKLVHLSSFYTQNTQNYLHLQNMQDIDPALLRVYHKTEQRMEKICSKARHAIRELWVAINSGKEVGRVYTQHDMSLEKIQGDLLDCSRKLRRDRKWIIAASVVAAVSLFILASVILTPYLLPASLYYLGVLGGATGLTMAAGTACIVIKNKWRNEAISKDLTQILKMALRYNKIETAAMAGDFSYFVRSSCSNLPGGNFDLLGSEQFHKVYCTFKKQMRQTLQQACRDLRLDIPA